MDFVGSWVDSGVGSWVGWSFIVSSLITDESEPDFDAEQLRVLDELDEVDEHVSDESFYVLERN